MDINNVIQMHDGKELVVEVKGSTYVDFVVRNNKKEGRGLLTCI